jgi:hypothetical protein
MVANVLSAEEYTKGKAIQEVTRAQETRHRPHAKVGPTLKKLTDFLLLRNIVTSVSTVLFHELKRMNIFLTCVLLPQGFHSIPNSGPCCNLIRGVINVFDGFVPSMILS